MTKTLTAKYFAALFAILAVFCFGNALLGIKGAVPEVQAGEKEAFGDLERFVQWDDVDEVKRVLSGNPKIANYNNGEILLSATGLVKKPEIIKMLLDAGANPNVKQTNTDNNPLHIILTECTPDNHDQVLSIVKMLVAKGTDVNHKRSNDGYTPLHIAARNEYVSKDIIASLLSAKNVDVNIRCNAINEFQDGAWPVLFYVITQPNDTTGTKKEIVKLIIDKGADLSATSTDVDPAIKQNWTVLHFLAETPGDRDDIALLLLDSGASLDLPCKTQLMTPLHIALMSNNPKICQLLLEKGADVNSKNSDGVTIVEHAKGWATDRHLDSAKVILDWAASH